MKIYYLFNIFFIIIILFIYLVNQSTEKYTSTNYQTDYIYLSLVSICIKLNMVFTPQKFNLNEILMSRLWLVFQLKWNVQEKQHCIGYYSLLL